MMGLCVRSTKDALCFLPSKLCDAHLAYIQKNPCETMKLCLKGEDHSSLF